MWHLFLPPRRWVGWDAWTCEGRGRENGGAVGEAWEGGIWGRGAVGEAVEDGRLVRVEVGEAGEGGRWGREAVGETGKGKDRAERQWARWGNWDCSPSWYYVTWSNVTLKLSNFVISDGSNLNGNIFE